MRLHLAETEGFSKHVFDQLSERYDVSAGPVSNLKRLLNEIDIFWFRLGYKINASIIDQNTRCKYLVTPVTGIDHIDEGLCEKYGVNIVCLRGEYKFLKEIRATAEHTILITMMLMRNAALATNDVLKENWDRDRFRGYELHKKKVGILGYGRLGEIVADYLHAMGCKIGYYDVVHKKSPEYFHIYESMEACIADNEIISLHVPYNSSTHHLLDDRVFSFFDSGKWLINTSRGGIIDDNALLKCLKERRIKGAALDVLWGEPYVEKNPLIKYANENNNLLITPHIGGCTFESFEKTEAFIGEKLLKLIRDQRER